jgi:hypothetical protein
MVSGLLERMSPYGDASRRSQQRGQFPENQSSKTTK